MSTVCFCGGCTGLPEEVHPSISLAQEQHLHAPKGALEVTAGVASLLFARCPGGPSRSTRRWHRAA